jgi:hypothetical protein
MGLNSPLIDIVSSLNNTPAQPLEKDCLPLPNELFENQNPLSIVHICSQQRLHVYAEIVPCTALVPLPVHVPGATIVVHVPFHLLVAPPDHVVVLEMSLSCAVVRCPIPSPMLSFAATPSPLPQLRSWT